MRQIISQYKEIVNLPTDNCLKIKLLSQLVDNIYTSGIDYGNIQRIRIITNKINQLKRDYNIGRKI